MKKSLKSLKLKKVSISNLTVNHSDKLKGGATNTCCNYSCSCDTVDPDLTAKCNFK
jgi:hypothetical protein